VAAASGAAWLPWLPFALPGGVLVGCAAGRGIEHCPAGCGAVPRALVKERLHLGSVPATWRVFDSATVARAYAEPQPRPSPAALDR